MEHVLTYKLSIYISHTTPAQSQGYTKGFKATHVSISCSYVIVRCIAHYLYRVQPPPCLMDCITILLLTTAVSGLHSYHAMFQLQL